MDFVYHSTLGLSVIKKKKREQASKAEMMAMAVPEIQRANLASTVHYPS